jgi:hypothetical protein
MKYCPKCKIEKEFEEFHPRKQAKSGFCSWCKSCVKQQLADVRRKNGIKPRSHKFCPKGHDKDIVGRTETGRCAECYKISHRERQLKQRYEITVEDYNKLLSKQNYKCAICEKLQVNLAHRLSIDHNHITGKIRGLLCNPCNIALGHFYDSLTNLEKAIEYLRQD